MNPNNSLILVVDDETKIRRLISTNLAFEGFDVVQAEDGKRALEVFNHSLNKPDLILLDLMMPEMDGMAMLKQLRRYSDVQSIKRELDGINFQVVSESAFDFNKRISRFRFQ